MDQFSPEKIGVLKSMGLTDDEIASLSNNANATQKAAMDQQVAFKADEPATDLPDVIINGVTYKAFPLPKDDAAVEVEAKAPLPGNAAEDALDGGADDAQETPDDAGGLTLSPEDITAIGQAVSQALTDALGPLVSTMDLTNKIGGHMDELKSMMGSYQTKKDSGDAQTKEQLAQLQQQVSELTGDQPAKPYRASEARGSAITDASLLLAAKAAEGNTAGPFDDIIQGLGLSRPQQ